MKRIQKWMFFSFSLSLLFLFLLVEIFCVCFSLILELKMLNLFVAGRCIFRGSCCFFFDSWAREVYMCGYFFCASSSYMSSGLILFLFLAVCVWVYVLFFFFLSEHIHMQCIYNLPDKREKKRRKMSLKLFLSLGGFFS